jgi:hypothetical protein
MGSGSAGDGLSNDQVMHHHLDAAHRQCRHVAVLDASVA